MQIPDWIPWVVTAVIVTGVVWWKFREDLLFLIRREETEGTIINWMSRHEGGRQWFYPLISFRTPSGQMISYRAEERSEGKPLFPPGTSVRVRYLPSNPRRVRTIYPKAEH